MATTPAGKYRGNRIHEPIGEGLISRRIAILPDLLHDVTVVYGDVIKRFRDVRDGIGMNLAPFIPPRQVGNMGYPPFLLETRDQLEEGHFR